jgi:outer membrane receptor protein involved in Fe transport
VNASEKIELVSNVYLQLIVNNIANKQPPRDPTNNFYPYYDTTLYNAYGRAYWIELEAKLGGNK